MNFITVIAVLQSFTAGSRLISDGICKLSHGSQLSESKRSFQYKVNGFIARLFASSTENRINSAKVKIGKSNFFSNSAPSVLRFFRVSRIDFTKPFFDIRPERRYFELISNFAPMRLYMDQNRNKFEKASKVNGNQSEQSV